MHLEPNDELPVLNPSAFFHELCFGRFEVDRVRIRWQPGARTRPPELIEAARRFWQRETADQSHLFNGRLCRLDGWQVHNGELTLHLGLTDYQELLFSNAHTADLLARYGEAGLSRALGISAVLVSRDQQVVLIERSHTVGECPGALDVLGGHIHPEEHATAGTPDPFRAIADEILEEVGLTLRPNDKVTCFGLIETADTRKPELLFDVRCERTAEEIVAAGANTRSNEIARFLTVPNRKPALLDFLTREQARFSPSALGVLWLYIRTLEEA